MELHFRMCRKIATALFSIVLLIKLGESVITINPNNVMQKANSMVMIDCTARLVGAGKITIRWLKQTTEYPRDNNDDVYMLSNNTLVIKKLKRRYTGTYKCDIESESFESLYKTVEVEIGFVEKIKGGSDNITAFVSQSVTIDCKEPVGNPRPDQKWFFGLNQPKLVDFSNSRFSQDKWKLKISSLQKSDEGPYTCVAFNFAKSRNKTMWVKAVVPGSNVVTPTSQVRVEDETAVVDCKSESEPALPVTWRKAVQKCIGTVCTNTQVELPDDPRFKVYPNGSLVITQLKPEDQAVYMCLAQMAFKQN